MHELAIAQTLCDTALTALDAEANPQHGPIRVMRVRLGPLAGVSKEELAFGFDVVTRGTPFDGASLEIEEVPAVVACDDCGAESQLAEPEPLLCPSCGGTNVRVVQGKELMLQSIEMDE